MCLCSCATAEGRHVDAIATALVFFHKFFMLHSFQRHDRVFIGSACLFLAAKVEVGLLDLPLGLCTYLSSSFSVTLLLPGNCCRKRSIEFWESIPLTAVF